MKMKEISNSKEKKENKILLNKIFYIYYPIKIKVFNKKIIIF